MSYEPASTRYDSMPYNRCGRSGLKLPAISLGLWHNFGGIDAFFMAQAQPGVPLAVTWDDGNSQADPYTVVLTSGIPSNPTADFG